MDTSYVGHSGCGAEVSPDQRFHRTWTGIIPYKHKTMTWPWLDLDTLHI